ncbi:hypothetical protein IWW50_000736 [Coemansia erecta]|nr:hypothetical protein IWW50_000736 [Coemansia erecta]
MKLGFVALLFALSSVIAQPIANPDSHLELRAAVKINKARIGQAIKTDNNAAAQQRNVINQLNSAMSALSSMSGKSITAARRAHLDAINAQKRALKLTQNAAAGLKRIYG